MKGQTMTTINLQDEVAKAVDAQWDAFVSRHPRLARVIDRNALVEEAMLCLSDTPEFQEAMERSAQAGAAVDSIAIVLKPLVRRVLDGLL